MFVRLRNISITVNSDLLVELVIFSPEISTNLVVISAIFTFDKAKYGKG